MNQRQKGKIPRGFKCLLISMVAAIIYLRMTQIKLQVENLQELDGVTASSLSTERLDDIFQPNEICSMITKQQPSTSATRLWQAYLPDIVEASKNPLVAPELQTEKVNAESKELLETVLTPARLKRAVTHLPTFSHESIKQVIQILEKRIQDPNENPPLKIAVFGGSVTLGRGCFGKRMQYVDCAWPKRFELLVNQFTQKEIIKVYNLAIGGTGSTVGTNMIKYWMLPQELKKLGPDIIVNSYSTNDSLPPWNLKDEDDVVTIVTDNIRNYIQPFIREALQMKPCDLHPPLVVHVDDYLGPQQPSILGDMTYENTMTQLARWYDTFAISYGEVVRDLVFQNIDDKTFFNKNDVHYGPTAHQTIAWSVGFSSLQLLTNYCDDEYTARTSNRTHDSTSYKINRLFLPPPLTRELLRTEVTKEFNAALEMAQKSYQDLDCPSTNSTISVDDLDFSPCIVSWISSPGGFNPGQINQFMKTYTKSNNNWKTENDMAEGWGNKIGWIATSENAAFNLVFNSIDKSVKTVSIYFIRSYGPKWKDSRVKFTISHILNNKQEVVAEKEVAGVHENEEYKYSLTLSELIVLPKAVNKGETLEIQVDLISGSHFKIMGMMICNK